MLLPFSLNPPAHQGTGDSSPPSSGPCSDEPLITPRVRELPAPPLLDADAFVRMAFAESPLPIVALDVEGRVALWNGAAETTFGWSASEAIGTRPSPELAELCARALAGEKLLSVATSPARKDGMSTRLRVSLARLRSEAGTIEGVMAIFSPA
jgi:PAS domain S-box-containing protein